jgi:hypothetical protein
MENEQLTRKVGSPDDIESLKKTLEKTTEIQKLLESNMQTLENRCELLEMQNE